MLPARVAAQRERAVLRLESFGAAPSGAASARDVEQRALQLALAHRVIRDRGNTMLLVGAQYRDTRVALTGLGAPLSGGATSLTNRVQVVTADLWLLRTLNAKHTLVAVARPGVYGDLDAIGNQWRVEGALFVDRIMSSRTTLGVGMSYASNFGRVLAVPVLHVVARPRRRLLVDALLPSRADLWWMPRKGLDLGVGASLTGAQYGLANSAAQPQNATTLQLANATIGPQLRWTPRGKVQLTADAGTTVLRRLEYARGSRTVADLTPGNVLFGRLGAQWLF
jgi:hypothetical protein